MEVVIAHSLLELLPKLVGSTDLTLSQHDREEVADVSGISGESDLLKRLLPVIVTLQEAKQLAGLLKGLAEMPVHRSQVLEGGGAADMMEQQAHVEQLTVGREDVVDSADVWLTLAGLPGLLVKPEVFWHFGVEETSRSLVGGTQVEEGRQCGSWRLQKLLRPDLPGVEGHVLVAWQVDPQRLDRRKVVVDLEAEHPPSCLSGRDVPAQLERLDLIKLVRVVDGVDAGVRSLVDVLKSKNCHGEKAN